jgi:uncharacterized membrane protein
MNKIFRWPAGEKPLFFYWIGTSALYCVLSLFRHWHFHSSSYDLGIADHALWHYSHFEAPADTLSHFNNLLGDHFDPTVALLTPLYWIFPRAETLLVAQAFLLTLPVFPIFLFARKRFSRFTAYGFALCYALLWELQVTAEFDFHELALAVPAAAFALYFADEEKWGPFYASVFFMMMCKENLCLLVIFFGFVLMVKGKIGRGAILSAAALALFLFEVKFLIPYLGKRPYSHWTYTQLGSGPFSAFGNALTHPWRVLELIFSNSTKTITIFCLFLPFFFTAIFSPWCLLAVPMISERMLSSDPNFWIMMYQYNALWAPLTCLASIDGLDRLARRVKDPAAREKAVARFTWVLLAFNLITFQLPRFPLGHLIRHPFWSFTQEERTGAEALALIPKGASVFTQSSLAPHLSDREVVDQAGIGWRVSPPDEDYVILSMNHDAWPVKSSDLPELLALKKKQGYSFLFNQDGWLVLRMRRKANDHVD